MRFFHLLWFNCQFIFAIFLKVSIRLVYLLSCESEAPRSDSSTLRRAFWHPEEEFLFAGKDPDSEPALSAEGQQGIHADHTQTHTRSSNNAEETQTHTHTHTTDRICLNVRKHMYTMSTHSSSSFQLFSKCWLHKTPGGRLLLLLMPPPRSGCWAIRSQGGWAGPADLRCSVTWGWGPERATAPGPLGWAPLPPLSPSSPSAPRAAHLMGDMGRDSNGLGTTGRGGEDEKLKAWNSSSVWDARVTLCQVRWRREEGREGAVIRWF